MASHPLEPDRTSLITDEPGAGSEPVDRVRHLLQIVVRKVNGLLSFGTGVHGSQAGNVHGQWMTYTTPSTPGTAFAVPHGLGRVPTAVFTAVTQFTNTVSDGVDDKGYFTPPFAYADPAQAWTAELVWLKCNTPSAKLALLIV